jgi:hypothetical protein
MSAYQQFDSEFISFMESIHPGPVNLAVINATLFRNFKTGVWVAASNAHLSPYKYSTINILQLSKKPTILFLAGNRTTLPLPLN